MHQIVNRAPFAQEFRVAHDIELCPMPIIPLNGFRDAFAGFDRHGAFVDDHAVIGENIRDLAGNFFDKAKIDISVGLRRSGHRNEDDLRFINAFANAIAEMQAPRGNVAMHDFFEAGLVNGDSTGL